MCPSQSPYNAADVTPTSGVPDASIRSQATPEDFGSQVAKETEKTGDTVEDLGVKYLQMATEAKAENTIANQFVPAAAQLKADYMKNKGMDALKAQPEYLASVQNLRKQFVGGANSPYEAQILSQYMERHAALETDFSAEYAAKQQTEYEGQTYKAMQDTYSNNAAQNYKNPSVVEQNLSLADGLAKKHTIDSGQHDDNLIDYQIRLNRDGAVKDIVEAAIANHDVPAAIDYFSKYKSTMTAVGARQVEVALTPKARDYDAKTLVNQNLGEETAKYHDVVYGLSTYGPPAPKDPIDFVQKHEGGYVSNDSGKGPTNFGINQESNPDIDVKNLTKEQAAGIIKSRYADPIGADKMSPDMAMVSVDSAVNMGVAKTQKLLAEAANDPQKMIDLRRQEYQRLATENPAKYGASLPGWMSRMDDLQKSLSTHKSNPIDTDGKILPSMGDFYRANWDDTIANARAKAEKQYPDDPDYADKAEALTRQHMKATIDAEANKKSETTNVVLKALNGDFSKGVVPSTVDQLLATSPQVQQAWNVMQNINPAKVHEIETNMVGKDTVSNSHNGYDAIKSVVDNAKDQNISSQQMEAHLHERVGRKDNTGYNLKDYNDAKPSLDASQPWAKFLSDGMDAAANANGNVDGQGQQRAVDWYNYMLKEKQANEAKGEAAIPDSKFIKQMQDVGPHLPSRMQQIENWAKGLFAKTPQQAAVPVFSSPSDPAFAVLPKGSQFRTSDGRIMIKQ